MARKKKGIPGLSWSWKRATGVSGAKGKASQALGIPLTRQGRQRKLGKSTGCLIPLALTIAAGAAGGVVVLAGAG